MPRSPEYDLIMSSLGHDWVDLEELYSSLINKVQPGKAKRHYMMVFEAARAKASGKGPAKGPLPEFQQIHSGARILLRNAVYSATQAANIVEKKVGDVTYVRRNTFTADEVDSILAQKVTEDIQLPDLGDDPYEPTNPHLVYLDEMMFDIRTVQSIVVRATSPNQVTVVIGNVVDGQDLSLSLVSQAADWLSDQLGFQALAARKGKENSRKALPVSQDLS